MLRDKIILMDMDMDMDMVGFYESKTLDQVGIIPR